MHKVAGLKLFNLCNFFNFPLFDHLIVIVTKCDFTDHHCVGFYIQCNRDGDWV